MRDTQRAGMAIALLLAGAAAAFAFATLPGSLRLLPWKGARLVAVNARTPEASVVSALESAHLAGILSMSGQKAWFSDFDAWESVDLPRLDERLLPEDPRRDPFLDGMKGYFTASSGEERYGLYYLLGNGMSNLALRRSLEKALGKAADWILVESEARSAWQLGFCAWVLFFVLLLLTSDKRSMMACLPFLGWMGVSLSSSWIFLLCCLPMALLMYRLSLASIRYPYEKRYGLSFFVHLLEDELGLPFTLCLGVFALAGFFMMPLSYGLSLISAGAFFSFNEILLHEKRGRAFHSVFQPLQLRIRVAKRFLPRSRPLTALLFAFAAAVLSLSALSLPPSARKNHGWNNLLSFPHPRGYTGAAATEARLPGYRDYLSHLDFQAGFLETDLSDSEARRAFSGYSLKKDGALSESAERGPRLDPKAGRGGAGIESLLKLAGEKETIVEGAWESGGIAGGLGGWLPKALAVCGLAAGIIGLAAGFLGLAQSLARRKGSAGSLGISARIDIPSGRRKNAL